MSDDAPETRLADQLHQLLAAVEASGQALIPASNLELLQTIVEAAARIFGAAAASISLVDETEQTLEFKVAFGAGRDEVLGMRIPIDQGIAGYVANSGQPIAISNVQQDPRFNREFARSTGYVPKSILATPLIIHDRVIGVMEVLDKIDAPAFGMEDMDLLGVFALQAAMAIEQSRQLEDLDSALQAGIGDILGDAHEGRPDTLLSVLQDETTTTGVGRSEMMRLAGLFFEISRAGEAEKRACLQILTAFRDYLNARPSFR